MNLQLKKYTQRIEFWILVCFLIRLVGITNPPLEISHNWRQVTGLMVARNFLEVDPNILYARIDDNNGGTGIIGIEFPSMNYCYYLIAKVFGYTHWYGRLINLVVSSFGLFYFYKILKINGFKERLAFFATIFLTCSIWFTFSRKMMPDTYCISIMFAGIYFGMKYLNENKIIHLVVNVLLCSLAILSKIPAGIYFITLLPTFLNSKIQLKSKFILTICSILPLLLTYSWYFVWNPKISSEYGNWYNSGKPMLVGISEIISNMNETLDNFYFDSFYSYFTFLLFVSGLIVVFLKRDKKIIVAFLLPFAVFLVYIFKSGYYFYHHNYYIIPFVPVMAIVVSYALIQIEKKWLFNLILILCITESIANQQHDFFIKNSEKYKMSLSSIMDNCSKKEDLILVNGNENPQLIYLAHRKGWNCSDAQISERRFLNEIKEKKCKFIVLDKHSTIDFENLNMPYKSVFENDDFLIFRIS